jgi:hypothetical protein
MQLQDITSENDLRNWLRDNAIFMRGVTLQWVEPSPLIGSAIGAADVIMKCGDYKIDVELKYLVRKMRGIKFTLRPSQRRFHHSSMRRGGKTALLFLEAGNKKLWIIRGDKIPLRDYALDPDSGCQNGVVDMWIVSGKNDAAVVEHLTNILFHSIFWRSDA